MKFTVVIPARYASSRFPGKPLADIGGKPMVVRVCERAAASGCQAVYVATDDERVASVVRDAGHAVLMTRSDHVSGTDRVAEAALQLGLRDEEILVNVQGDEPLVPPALIRAVAGAFDSHPQASVTTACHSIHDEASLANPNVVKVVMDAGGYALYFSRARIPFPREGGATSYRHAGIYGYRAGFLRQFSNLEMCPLEKAEALEQLRVLWHGFRIAVAVSETDIPPGVDTPHDLEAVRRMLA